MELHQIFVVVLLSTISSVGAGKWMLFDISLGCFTVEPYSTYMFHVMVTHTAIQSFQFWASTN